MESNKKFSIRLCNDGDTEKIQLFKLLSEIITIEDFNKIFKMTEKKWIDNDTYCIIDYNKNLQKERRMPALACRAPFAFVALLHRFLHDNEISTLPPGLFANLTQLTYL